VLELDGDLRLVDEARDEPRIGGEMSQWTRLSDAPSELVRRWA